jgi:hypothetical protein
MKTADALDLLAQYAELLIEISQKTIRDDIPVAPLLVTMDPEGTCKLYGMFDANTPEERQRLKEFAAETDHAVAVMFFSDGYMKNPENHEERIGEMLTACIEARDGSSRLVGCRYYRDPLRFDPITSSTGLLWVPGQTFSGSPETTH